MLMLNKTLATVVAALIGLSGVLFAQLSFSCFSTKVAHLLEWTIEVPISGTLVLPLYGDFEAFLFLASVSAIASSVLLFSSDYMSGDKHFVRFHFLVFVFVASMFLLIMSPNLLSLMLGWDGLGVTSFLLVIYFQNSKSNNAGMLTVLTNRLGDVSLLSAIALFSSTGSWSLFVNSKWETQSLWVGLLLITLAGFTKSAQVPFSAWLPAAMAAPTPVSSLVHSSTLVTAGVFILFRLFPEGVSCGLGPLVFLTGALTGTLASVSALLENDMKKIVALSTLSQLGLMISGLGLGLGMNTYCHLLAHAYFKAMLFVTVGNMIHLSSAYQDLRKANLTEVSSTTISLFMVANLSLCGFPFLSGFYSKDLMLESAANLGLFLIGGVLLLSSVGVTAAYTSRLLFLTLGSVGRKSPLFWESDITAAPQAGAGSLLPLAVAGGYFLVTTLSPLSQSSPTPGMLKAFIFLMIGLGGVAGHYLVFNPLFSKAPIMVWSWGSMWALPHFSGQGNSQAQKLSWYSRGMDLAWINWLPLASPMGLLKGGWSDPHWPNLMGVSSGALSALSVLLFWSIY